MALNQIQLNAVLSAIAEYDAMGQEEFLRHYGFGQSKAYFLSYEGKYYDSKAILGVAHRFQFPESAILTAQEFSGGENTVKAHLERLGFTVEVRKDITPIPLKLFTEGQEYRRRELHNQYGGQQQGGISTPKLQPFIFLFASKIGEDYGYSDGWTDEGVYLYTGEGTRGDMTFQMGNKAIRDHMADGKDIYLFQSSTRAYVKFIGQMICVGFHYHRAPDYYGGERQAIVFQLMPVDLGRNAQSSEVDTEESIKEISSRSVRELRERAVASATLVSTPVERTTQYFNRSRAITNYALKRAEGICGGCQQPAPFLTRRGVPFLEVHHLDRLADDGPDHPDAVIAVCPNCHTRAHIAIDAEAFNEALRAEVKIQEQRVM